MKRLGQLVALALLVAALAAPAAAQVTATESRTRVFSRVDKVIFAWTSDGSGDATGVTSFAYDGKVIGLTTDPDGTAAPLDNYDIVVNDSDGHDILLGAGANRDTANTEHVAQASLGAVAGSTLTLVVANAGASKQGVVILYID